MSGIFSDLRQAATDAGDWYNRLEQATRARQCIWDGQSDDGRKHGKALGREAFPWEGASDVRVRTIDEIANEQGMLMMRSFLRSRIQAVGIETSDLAWGQRVTSVLKYVIGKKMRRQVRRELGMAAQWRQWFGASVTAIMWDQQLRKMEQTVTVEGLVALLLTDEEMQDPNAMLAGKEAALQLLLDPAREEQALNTLMGLSPILTKSGARRALGEMRETGSTVIDVPEPFAAEPKITALLPMVDIFFPVLTDDIQRAPWVAHREELSPEELRDRINTAGYDKEWVEKAIEKKGQRFDGVNQLLALNTKIGIWNDGTGAKRDIVEIFHVYRRRVGSDGIPEIRCSVECAGVPDSVGKDEKFEYLHGEYPYVVHQRETLLRPILESRGVAELAATWQYEQKVQRDARTDRTAVTVLPPLIVPARRGAGRLRIGPGAQIPAAGRNEQYEWMRTPAYDAGSIEIEKATERSIGRYFGRMSEEVPPQLVELHQGDLVDGWLIEVQLVCSQILALCQQYMTDEQVARIAGPLGRPWNLTAAEIQGQYDLSVECDPRDLNIEVLKEKWGFLEIILKYDRGGRTDFSKLIEYGMSAIDPSMADAILIPMEAANQKQVSEELDALQKMISGIEPEMDPNPGMNYQLRMQVLQDAIQKNPEMQRRIAAQPDTAAMIENRMKFLSFQVQQQQNAQIGRVGTGEVLK